MSQTDRLLSLLPALMALHNLEEYLGMEDYARRRHLSLSHRQVQIALGLATLLPAIIAALAAGSPPRSRRKLAGLALPGLMLANAISHAGQTLALRDRSPGTWTALGLCVPFSLYLADQAVSDGYLTRRERRQVMGLGAALMPPSAVVLQGLGWLVDHLLSS